MARDFVTNQLDEAASSGKRISLMKMAIAIFAITASLAAGCDSRSEPEKLNGKKFLHSMNGWFGCRHLRKNHAKSGHWISDGTRTRNHRIDRRQLPKPKRPGIPGISAILTRLLFVARVCRVITEIR
jgi:hypothetical protein